MVKYFKDILLGFWTIMVGMKITMDHLFQKKVTMQYPERFDPIDTGFMPDNSRNKLFVDIDDCNGCGGCERDCPVNCITVETVKTVPSDGPITIKSGAKRTLWVLKHEIDYSKCCFCSLCVESCATSAIFHTKEFDYSGYDRNELKHDFVSYSDEEKQKKLDNFVAYQIVKKQEDAAKKAADEAAKAAAAQITK
ncbi:MAG: NADH-quinone oxidoreductase subunit I [Candidatus Kapabacteria bacterium]|nr:NADH-quinone oxidoreductase subunit I [Candidatus Kapabacteria bacterium]